MITYEARIGHLARWQYVSRFGILLSLPRIDAAQWPCGFGFARSDHPPLGTVQTPPGEETSNGFPCCGANASREREAFAFQGLLKASCI